MDINTIEVAKLGLLFDVAARALDADWEEDAENAAHADLVEGYETWKAQNSVDHVVRDSPEWEAMMACTAEAHRYHEDQKRKHRNARRRLRTACARYRNFGK